MTLKNKISTLVFLSVCNFITYATGKVPLDPFENIEKSDSLQRCIINDYKRYGDYYGYDDIQRLSSLCVRAFIASIRENIPSNQRIEVFKEPDRNWQVGINKDDCCELSNTQEHSVISWLNQCPFSYHPLYEAVNFIKLLNEGNMLILCGNENKGMELRIYLISVIKINKYEVCRTGVTYDFGIAYLEDSYDEELHKEAVESFIETIKRFPLFILEEDDSTLIAGSLRYDMGWKLLNINYEDSDYSNLKDLPNDIRSIFYWKTDHKYPHSKYDNVEIF